MTSLLPGDFPVLMDYESKYRTDHFAKLFVELISKKEVLISLDKYARSFFASPGPVFSSLLQA